MTRRSLSWVWLHFVLWTLPVWPRRLYPWVVGVGLLRWPRRVK